MSAGLCHVASLGSADHNTAEHFQTDSSKRCRGRKAQRKPSGRQVTTFLRLLPSLPLPGEGVCWDSGDASPINSAERRNHHLTKKPQTKQNKKKINSNSKTPYKKYYSEETEVEFWGFCWVFCCFFFNST